MRFGANRATRELGASVLGHRGGLAILERRRYLARLARLKRTNESARQPTGAF